MVRMLRVSACMPYPVFRSCCELRSLLRCSTRAPLPVQPKQLAPSAHIYWMAYIHTSNHHPYHFDKSAVWMQCAPSLLNLDNQNWNCDLEGDGNLEISSSNDGFSFCWLHTRRMRGACTRWFTFTYTSSYNFVIPCFFLSCL
jgi:hypothetical protein